jgi:glycosyltransferase involved in cell wall biosynthesis
MCRASGVLIVSRISDPILKPVVLIAPFSPVGSCENPNLGSASKIKSLIRILSRFGRPIVLINTAHNSLKARRTNCKRSIENGVEIIQITPFTMPWRPVGKLLNLFITRSLASEIAKKTPTLIWIYNGYAFESKFALELRKLFKCPIILELEDHPLSRKRKNFNIKPRIDYKYFKKALEIVDLLTCVNVPLMHDKLTSKKNKILLPSILNPKLFQFDKTKPFEKKPFTLGYFGGLSVEKGCDVVVELMGKLPAGWNLIITGNGPLSSQIEEIASKYPDKIDIKIDASEDELYQKMSQCDVVLNPHKSIKILKNGIFPFKVFEALAAGRLLISTELPDCGIDLNGKIILFDGSFEDLFNKMNKAEEFYKEVSSQLQKLSGVVKNKYSEDAFYQFLSENVPFDSN